MEPVPTIASGTGRVAEIRAEFLDPRKLVSWISELGVDVAEPVVELAGDVGVLKEVQVRCPANLPDPAAVPGQC